MPNAKYYLKLAEILILKEYFFQNNLKLLVDYKLSLWKKRKKNHDLLFSVERKI